VNVGVDHARDGRAQPGEEEHAGDERQVVRPDHARDRYPPPDPEERRDDPSLENADEEIPEEELPYGHMRGVPMLARTPGVADMPPISLPVYLAGVGDHRRKHPPSRGRGSRLSYGKVHSEPSYYESRRLPFVVV
jgi:hypothetical protein